MRLFVTFLVGMTISAAYAQSPSEKLAAHTTEFTQKVVKITNGVYMAIGYGLANSILIEGDDGVIIVDTMESPVTAKLVRAEFDKITTKPVKAIIYTHYHADHIGGAKTMAGGAQDIEVYAHATTLGEVEGRYNELRAIETRRAMRQFGVGLPPDVFMNCGIGPRLVPNTANVTAEFMPPTKTLDTARASYEAAGIKFDLVHQPGETDDQIYVWLPEKKVLMCGDNYYKSFPNLYAIRGTSYRDVRKWADSVDLLIEEGAEYLVPSHTRPLAGAEVIRETLSNYRDAIRYVHDETVKGINQGKTPDELAQAIHLPEELASKPYLQEFYGTVAWSVRNIFNGYLGWFDGNATNLSPLTPRERAERVVRLSGGPQKLLEAARAALAGGDAQWAAELADMLLALEYETPAVKALKADALTKLADGQTSANGRNYYSVSARELRQ